MQVRDEAPGFWKQGCAPGSDAGGKIRASRPTPDTNATTLGPQKLIIGGGVSQALDLMAGRIQTGMREILMPPFRDVEVARAALGDDAGLAGMVFEGGGVQVSV